MKQYLRDVVVGFVVSAVVLTVVVLVFLAGGAYGQQAVYYQDPPSHPFVLRATVPGMTPPLTFAGIPTDSRLVLTLEDGTPVTEVVATVPAGTSSLAVSTGTVSSSAPAPADAPFAWLGNAARVILRIDGHPFSLSNPRDFVRWYRDGRQMKTAEMHRTLGAYGALEWWITGRDGQLDFELLWHRAAPGPGVVFNRAELVVVGASWTPTLPDPVCAPPYLVTPGDRRIPQQCGRAFFLSIRPDGQPPEPDRVGTADWSGGGFMSEGFPIAYSPAVDFAPELATASDRLARLAPDPSWGAPPTSAMWPANGERFGGTGGGTDRVPIDGARWAASHGDPSAFKRYLVEFLRGLSRARLRLEPDGQPLRLANLARTWDFDTTFLGGRDSPWNWHAYWDPWTTDDPRLFADHDTASMLRRLNEAWTLVWLANDPLARLITLEGATRALLTYGPLNLPWTSDRGTELGAPQAVCALAIAPARALGATQYGSWRTAFINHFRLAQMPSGCFTARSSSSYPYDGAPFNGQYLLQGAAEFSYIQLALYSFGERDAVRLAARGMVGLATDDDDAGLYYYTATGQGTTRFLDENAWPTDLHDAMGLNGTAAYYTAWDMANDVALAFKVGAPERFELLRRLTGYADPANALAVLRSWGMEAPSAQSSAPFDQFGALLGVLAQ